MEITQEDRRWLAERIVAQRKRIFGTKSGAYGAAKLNSATWDRLEDGLPVREDRLAAAITTLWPSSGGDWRKIGDADAARPADEPWYVADIRGQLESLEARVALIEERSDGARVPGKRVTAKDARRGPRAPRTGASRPSVGERSGSDQT